MKHAFRLKTICLLLLGMLCTVSVSGMAEPEIYTCESNGFGGSITVTIGVENGQIVDCTIIGEGETPAIGGKTLPEFETQIVERQGQVDSISGATVTSNGVRAALQQAMTQAGLLESNNAVMVPGTYIGEAHGFSYIDYVTISISVSDTEIKDIHLMDHFMKDMDSYENRYLCTGAFERMAPQILEYQSLDVDAVTGATSSSNGIRNAVRNALTSAYCAGGLSTEEAAAAVNEHFTGRKAAKKEDTVELHYDVVVIGAGASGSIASLTALEKGASVLNIEKTFRWGGQSMMTGGPKVYNENTTPEQAEEILAGYNMLISSSRYGPDVEWNDPAYQAEHADVFTPVNGEAYKAVVPASGKAVRTLLENGMKLFILEFSPDPDVVNAFMANLTIDSCISVEDTAEFPSFGMGTTVNYYMGEEYFDRIFESYVQKGGHYLLNTTAKELIYADDTKQQITGVRAYGDDGTTYVVYADAVILASGGYGGNEELMDLWAAGGDEWTYYGWQGNDGDGILMALDAGANPYNLDAYPMSHQRMGYDFVTKFDIQMTEAGQPWSPNDLAIVLACNSDGVFITEDGTNFRSEELGSMNGFAGSMGTYFIGSSYYVVYSDEQLEAYRTQGVKENNMAFMNVGFGVPVNYPLGDWVDNVLGEAMDQNWAWKVASLAEGNQLLDLPEGTLEAAYSADPTELNSAGDTGYTIMRCKGLAISSCGGIQVNGKMQAVRPDGTAIDNLFVTGNDAFGNIMSTGAEYPIGGDAGMFVFGSGSIAGEEAALLTK